MPARVPPHRATPAAPPLHRFAMVSLAVTGDPTFFASDLELSREGLSYTVDTVTSLREHGEVVLIVGSDNLPLLPSWKDAERLLELCTVAVVGRPGQVHAVPSELKGGRFHAVDESEVPVSSSDLRRRVKEGRSIRYLTPPSVARYIEDQGLYR
jgi:nicotinate-nucleotide adenylyltransferase